MKHNCKVCRKPSPVSIYGVHEVLSSEPFEFEGRLLTRSVFKIDDPATRYDGMDVSHFYFENLVAAGVELKDFHLRGSDIVAATNATRDFIKLHELYQSVNVDNEPSKTE